MVNIADQLANFNIASLDAAFVIKIFLLTVLFIYFFFTLAVVKQVAVINKVLETNEAKLINLFARFQLALTLIIFVVILLL